MSQAFNPSNDLERALLDAQAGRIPPQAFMQTLMGAEVFMPVYEKYQIAGFGVSQQAQPLVLKDPDSGAERLALFTSPERAKEFLKDYPGHGGGLVAEFTWILEKAGVGYGISLNPGLEVGLELEAEALQQLARCGH